MTFLREPDWKYFSEELPTTWCLIKDHEGNWGQGLVGYTRSGLEIETIGFRGSALGIPVMWTYPYANYLDDIEEGLCKSIFLIWGDAGCK